MKSLSLKAIKYTTKLILFSAVLTFLFLLPDFNLAIFKPTYMVTFYPKALAFIFLSSIFLLTVKSNIFFYTASVLGVLLTFAGSFHFLYFGRYFIGYDISLMLKESTDVFLAFFASFAQYYYTLIGLLLSLAGIIYIRRQANKHLPQSNWLIFACIATYLILPWQIYKRGSEFALPNSSHYMLYNSLKSFSSFLLNNTIQKGGEVVEFKPYQITKQQEIKDKTTIILIFAESLNMKHLSLFGYNRNTTPNLKKLAKDKNFYYTKALSHAVVTRASVSGFFNLQKEPQNFLLQQSKAANLFRLAQNAGFYSTFVSTQTFSSFPNVGLEFTDNYANKYEGKIGDNFWLNQILAAPIHHKNFIAVQTRLVHYPYKRAWEHRPEFNVWHSDNAMTDEYDNGLLYLDDLLGKTIDYAKSLDGKVYVIVVSDHNELFGEGGLWGHSFLDYKIAEIPFILWSKNVEEKSLQSIKQMYMPSHWDIGRFIAEQFGYTINNPNTPDNILYIQGTDVTGAAGFEKYKREADHLVKMKINKPQ